MWYLIESPFGRIAHTVSSDGTMYLQPHSHATELEQRHDHILDRLITVPADAPKWGEEGRPVLIINGKRYGDELGGWSGRVELRNGEPRLTTNYSDPLTSAAYSKLSEWLNAHYAEMATPVRLAQARYDKATSDVHYRLKDVREATAELDKANAEQYAAYDELRREAR